MPIWSRQETLAAGPPINQLLDRIGVSLGSRAKLGQQPTIRSSATDRGEILFVANHLHSCIVEFVARRLSGQQVVGRRRTARRAAPQPQVQERSILLNLSFVRAPDVLLFRLANYFRYMTCE
jgi:hypothetical protein